MKTEQTPTYLEKQHSNFTNSVSFKILSIAFLILLMLIPSAMIKDLISERQVRQQEAVFEVSDKWGHPQTLSGPIISVPYLSLNTNATANESRYIKRYAHFLPESLHINGSIVPHERKRSIFKVVLYESDLQISGKFIQPDFSLWKIDKSMIKWDEASIAFGISDMRGIKEDIKLDFNGNILHLEPGVPCFDVLKEGVNAPIEILSDSSTNTYSFTFKLKLNGSKEINFIPLGKESTVKLESSWAHPSFIGNFLPTNRNVTENGFTADWKVLQLNRNYPQKWVGSAYNPQSAAFGVTLMIDVDDYQKNTRTAKYAVLIISLSFIIFFFMEVINGKNIHPIQYLLVGFALCVFYTLLLAITEQSSFSIAYLISSIAIISLICMYVQGMFKNFKFTGLMGAFLVLIYGFLFIILQLQDYALLMGSIGLFVFLSGIMYYTRSIDWYKLQKEKRE
jgi:inner membrane protein